MCLKKWRYLWLDAARLGIHRRNDRECARYVRDAAGVSHASNSICQSCFRGQEPVVGRTVTMALASGVPGFTFSAPPRLFGLGLAHLLDFVTFLWIPQVVRCIDHLLA
jgi:hypothetical protein